MSDETKSRNDKDERVAIPLDPEEALRGLLKVDPERQELQDAGSPSEPPPS